MATTKTAHATALARQVQGAMTTKKPTAAARLNEIEPRVNTLTSTTAHLAQSVKQLDTEFKFLSQDVGLKVEQVQLEAALARVEALESRPVVPLGLLHNIQAQVAGFWVALGAIVLILGWCSPRPAPIAAPTSRQYFTPATPLASPTISPEVPDGQTAKPQKR